MPADSSFRNRIHRLLRIKGKRLKIVANRSQEALAMRQELLDLLYARIWYRPGSSMIVNGLVNIARIRDNEKTPRNWGSAHVHDYATSVIGNELQSILEDPAGSHDVELKLYPSAEPSLFDDVDAPSRIVFRYTGGPKDGRAFWFAPVTGDEDGWSEMVSYAQQLLATNAIQRICQQHEALAT